MTVGFMHVFAVSSAASTTSWDAAADFSGTNNPNGAWSYGWASSRTAQFNVDTVSVSFWDGLLAWVYSNSQLEPDVFYNPTNSTINPAGTNPIPAHTLGFHPGPAGQNAIVRWTAPHAGTYEVAATFTGRDTHGTSTDVAVLLNGAQLWAGAVNGYLVTQSFGSTRVTLNAGATVDFTVGFGADGSYLYDTTGLSAQVNAVIDTTPPVTTFTPAPGPLNGRALATATAAVAISPGNISFSATCFDSFGLYANLAATDDTSVASVGYGIAPITFGQPLPNPALNNTVNGSNATVPFLSSGAFVLNFAALDGAGNREAVKTRLIFVDAQRGIACATNSFSLAAVPTSGTVSVNGSFTVGQNTYPFAIQFNY
jgi:hypothetical protein